MHVLGEHCGSAKFEARSSKPVTVTYVRAEEASTEDLSKGDVLLLASGTWNTGGREGQLNSHMHEFLLTRAKDVSLKGRRVACIGLGDSRYRYTAYAAVRLEEFVKAHGGTLLLPALRIVDEPYGQEKKIETWGKRLLRKIATLPLMSYARI